MFSCFVSYLFFIFVALLRLLSFVPYHTFFLSTLFFRFLFLFSLHASYFQPTCPLSLYKAAHLFIYLRLLIIGECRRRQTIGKSVALYSAAPPTIRDNISFLCQPRVTLPASTPSEKSIFSDEVANTLTIKAKNISISIHLFLLIPIYLSNSPNIYLFLLLSISSNIYLS
ncbi:unnamed protein product [Acanthosepion pharaonis]|uniref:Uncharacterized protein n=1 Tax=Acanthosepion pharaonis TaxID=158019 RepID=A0A812F0C4_ACAPH|nr:unnamed protein product [Sepia pharaonis]